MQHDKQCELYGGFFSCKCEQRRPRVGTTDNLEALYEKHEDEFCKFDRVKNKSTTRGDLHAFLLLDRLIPSPTGCDIVSAANHDEIYLDTDPEEFVKVATEDHVIEIMRCGVRFDGSGFQMFV